MVPNDFEAPAELEQRDPDELDLRPLLELGPADRWGSWALSRARPNTLITWARTGALRGTLPHALVTFASSGSRHVGARIIGLQRRMCWLARETGSSASALRWRSASCAFDAFSVSALRCAAAGLERQDSECQDSECQDSRADGSGYLTTAFWDLWFPFGARLSRIEPKDVHRRFGRFGQTRWVEANVGGLLPPMADDPPNLGQLSESLGALGQRVYQNMNISIPASLVSLQLTPGPNPARTPPNSPPSPPWTVDAPLPEQLPDSWPMVVAFFASYQAGVRASADPSISRIVGEAHVHNLWLNLFFDAIVEIATDRNDPLTPDEHALLLALGLAQFQTTWRWPLSEHWQRWFADDSPPEHWLSAYVWHLCWAVGEPQTPAHLEQARACLERGDWPELVAALREHAVVPANVDP
jgi:hypothetical protein